MGNNGDGGKGRINREMGVQKEGMTGRMGKGVMEV